MEKRERIVCGLYQIENIFYPVVCTGVMEPVTPGEENYNRYTCQNGADVCIEIGDSVYRVPNLFIHDVAGMKYSEATIVTITMTDRCNGLVYTPEGFWSLEEHGMCFYSHSYSVSPVFSMNTCFSREVYADICSYAHNYIESLSTAQLEDFIAAGKLYIG